MAIMQYIGARYVPIFYENPNGTNDWLQGVAYEPLTVVTYAGNSYTSKKKVPANIGAPNMNSAYWASTGIYNAQMEAIRLQVVELEGEMTDVHTDVETLDSQVGQIPTLSARIEAVNDALTADIDAVEADIEDAKNPVMLILGDSWTAFSEGFENWSTLVEQMTGYTCISYGVGGTGWSHRGGNNVVRQGNFAEQLQYAINNMTAAQKRRVAKIVVIGGVNDLNVTQGNNVATAETSIDTGMGALATLARSAFPGVPVYAGINVSDYQYNNSNKFASRGFALEAYVITKIMPKYGIIPLLNMNWGLYVTSGAYRGDHLHPSATGAKVVSEVVIATISGAGYNAYFSNAITNWAITPGWVVEWSFTFQNGILTCSLNSIKNQTSSSQVEINYPDSGWGVILNVLHLIRAANFAVVFNGNGAMVGWLNWADGKVTIKAPANATSYSNSMSFYPASGGEN